MFTQATMRILNEMLELSYSYFCGICIGTHDNSISCSMFNVHAIWFSMNNAVSMCKWIKCKDSNKKKVNREKRFPILLGWFVQIRKLHLNAVAAFRIFKEVERMIWFGNKLRMHHANHKNDNHQGKINKRNEYTMLQWTHKCYYSWKFRWKIVFAHVIWYSLALRSIATAKVTTQSHHML